MVDHLVQDCQMPKRYSYTKTIIHNFLMSLFYVFYANTRQSSASFNQPPKKRKFEATCSRLNHGLPTEGCEYETVKINDSTKRLKAFKNLLSRNLITTRKSSVCKKKLYWYGEQSQPELDITQNNTINNTMIFGKTNQEQLVIESIHRIINHMKTMNWKKLIK